jgi:hypothetical protein
VLVTCDARDVNSGSGGQRRQWRWTYRDHAANPPVDRAGVAFVGRWYNDDDRDPYKYISVWVTNEGRFRPYVPYWSGFPGGPEFGHPSDFPRRGTLKKAIAYCERYLAKDEKDW